MLVCLHEIETEGVQSRRNLRAQATPHTHYGEVVDSVRTLLSIATGEHLRYFNFIALCNRYCSRSRVFHIIAKLNTEIKHIHTLNNSKFPSTSIKGRSLFSKFSRLFTTTFNSTGSIRWLLRHFSTWELLNKRNSLQVEHSFLKPLIQLDLYSEMHSWYT